MSPSVGDSHASFPTVVDRRCSAAPPATTVVVIAKGHPMTHHLRRHRHAESRDGATTMQRYCTAARDSSASAVR